MADLLRTNSAACRSLANPRRVRLVLTPREAGQASLDRTSAALAAGPVASDVHPGQLELRFGEVGP